MTDTINNLLLRDTDTFPLLDALNEKALWEFEESEQKKILDAAYLIWRPFESLYLSNIDCVKENPSNNMIHAASLLNVGAWSSVIQRLWSEKRLSSEFCEYMIRLA